MLLIDDRLLERQDDDVTPCRPRILTDRPAARLAPSGLRPNTLPLHNVRDRGPERNGGGLESCSPAIRPSSRQALARSTKLINCIGKDRSASIDSTPRQDLAVQTWWSQTGSNRRPHACEARALPTELWPRFKTRRAPEGSWWAWEDLNLRPHAYQARALTN